MLLTAELSLQSPRVAGFEIDHTVWCGTRRCCVSLMHKRVCVCECERERVCVCVWLHEWFYTYLLPEEVGRRC